MENKQYKKKWGDKRDGRLVKGDELDTNHFVMPLLWPNRTENEAYFNYTIDITNIDNYLAKYNAEHEEKISIFTIYLAASAKTFIKRPHLNRFYRHGKLYERYKTSIGFIVKKSLSDSGIEALARVYAEPEDNLFTFAKKMNDEIEKSRQPQLDKSSDDLRILMKFPHFVGRIVLGFCRWLNRHTVMPESMSSSDMFFCSIIASNLGSIGLQSGYHHLSNWGTNGYLTTLGLKKLRPFPTPDGKIEFRNSIDFGITCDETVADGFYYGVSLRMLLKYLEHPELLEKPFSE